MSYTEILFSFLPKFLHSQFFITPPQPSTDCSGRTMIVTGANTGLGKEIAGQYLRLNAAKVILACRNTDKGKAAKRDLEERFPGKDGVLEVWELDLASFGSVKAFAERCRGLRRVDALVENAGVSTEQWRVVEGFESTVTVNVISTFLLALLMLPILQRTAQHQNISPALTIVSSEVQFITQFPERHNPSIFEALSSKEKSHMSSRYPTSKLLEVLTVRELARLHPVSQLHVTLNFCNPGFCHSELTREIENPPIRLFKYLLCRSSEVGSRPLAFAGLAGPETHGCYLNNCEVEACAPLVEGPEGAELQRRVWGELGEILEGIQPGILKNLE